MKENINRILKMLEEGKIDAEKAAELIEALKEKEQYETNVSANKEKSLKVRILSGTAEKLNINLPIKFVKSSLKAFGKMPLHINGDMEKEINIQQIADAIENDIEGKIVDIKSDNGDTVEVVIE